MQKKQLLRYYFLIILIYPLPSLPPRGKEVDYLSPLGENERGYK
jgi:hypothetical protein